MLLKQMLLLILKGMKDIYEGVQWFDYLWEKNHEEIKEYLTVTFSLQ